MDGTNAQHASRTRVTNEEIDGMEGEGSNKKTGDEGQTNVREVSRWFRASRVRVLHGIGLFLVTRRTKGSQILGWPYWLGNNLLFMLWPCLCGL